MIDEYYSSDMLNKLEFVYKGLGFDDADNGLYAMVIELYGGDEEQALAVLKEMYDRANEKGDTVYRKMTSHLSSPSIESAMDYYGDDTVKAVVSLKMAVEAEQKAYSQAIREGWNVFIDRYRKIPTGSYH